VIELAHYQDTVSWAAGHCVDHALCNTGFNGNHAFKLPRKWKNSRRAVWRLTTACSGRRSVPPLALSV